VPDWGSPRTFRPNRGPRYRSTWPAPAPERSFSVRRSWRTSRLMRSANAVGQLADPTPSQASSSRYGHSPSSLLQAAMAFPGCLVVFV
jgi:hypothetical protein